jgi:hypothetical protein
LAFGGGAAFGLRAAVDARAGVDLDVVRVEVPRAAGVGTSGWGTAGSALLLDSAGDAPAVLFFAALVPDLREGSSGATGFGAIKRASACKNLSVACSCSRTDDGRAYEPINHGAMSHHTIDDRMADRRSRSAPAGGNVLPSRLFFRA